MDTFVCYFYCISCVTCGQVASGSRQKEEEEQEGRGRGRAQDREKEQGQLDKNMEEEEDESDKEVVASGRRHDSTSSREVEDSTPVKDSTRVKIKGGTWPASHECP